MSALEETPGVPLGAAADGRVSGVSSSAPASLDGRAHSTVASRRAGLRDAVAGCLDSVLDAQDGLSEFSPAELGLSGAQHATISALVDRSSRMLRAAKATMENR